MPTFSDADVMGGGAGAPAGNTFSDADVMGGAGPSAAGNTTQEMAPMSRARPQWVQDQSAALKADTVREPPPTMEGAARSVVGATNRSFYSPIFSIGRALEMAPQAVTGKRIDDWRSPGVDAAETKFNSLADSYVPQNLMDRVMRGAGDAIGQGAQMLLGGRLLGRGGEPYKVSTEDLTGNKIVKGKRALNGEQTFDLAPTGAGPVAAAATAGKVGTNALTTMGTGPAPVSIVASDATGNAISGAGAQAAQESLPADASQNAKELARTGGGMALPAGAALYSKLGPVGLGKMIASFAFDQTAGRVAGSAEKAAAATKAQTEWSNREGPYADPSVPRPPDAGYFDRKKAETNQGQSNRAENNVGKQLREEYATPEGQAASAEGQRLEESIPGLRLDPAQKTMSQRLITTKKGIDETRTGTDLTDAVRRRDNQAEAINRFAEQGGGGRRDTTNEDPSKTNVYTTDADGTKTFVRPGKPAMEPGIAPVANPDEAVGSATAGRIKGQLDPIDKEIASTQDQLKAARDGLPSVNTLNTGEELRNRTDAARGRMNTEAKQRYAAVDPGKTYVADSTPLNEGINRVLKENSTDLTDPVIPKEVRTLISKTEQPSAGPAPANETSLERAARINAGASAEPVTHDIESLLAARQEVNARMRSYSAGTPDAVKARDVLSGVGKEIDNAIAAAEKVPGNGGVMSRLRDANTWYKENYVPRFGQDLGQEMGQTRANSSAERVKGEDVSSRLIRPDSVSEHRQFNLIHGNDSEARQRVIDLALTDISSKIKGTTMPEDAVSDWLRTHAQIVKESPWLGDALKAEDPAALYSKLGEANARRKDIADGDFAKRFGPGADATKGIDDALANPARMVELKSSLAGDEAQHGALKRAVWDRVVTSGRQAGDPLLDPKAMRAFVDKNKRGIAAAFADNTQHLRDIDTMISAAERVASTPRPKGASEDARNPVAGLLSDVGLSVPSIAQRTMSVNQGRGSPVLAVVEQGSRVVNKLTNSQAEQAWKAALSDPDAAERMAAIIKTGSATQMQKAWFKTYVANLGRTATADDENPERRDEVIKRGARQ